MNQTHTSEAESLLDFVHAQLPPRVVAKEPAAVEHMVWILLFLRGCCRVLTAMLRGQHPWFTAKRCRGLNASRLFAPVEKELGAAAREPARRAAFWASPDLEEAYWPLLLRLYLEDKEDLKGKAAPGDYLALSLRVNVAGPLARRLLEVLDVASASSAEVARHPVVRTVRTKLGSFLRTLTREKGRPVEEDRDPEDLIARDFHNRHFAGQLAQLENYSVKLFHETLEDIAKVHGGHVADLLHAAALKAGEGREEAFGKSDAESEVSAMPGGAGRNDGLLLLSQLHHLQQLSDVLFHLGNVDEEEPFEALVRAEASRGRHVTLRRLPKSMSSKGLGRPPESPLLPDGRGRVLPGKGPRSARRSPVPASRR